MIKRFIIKIIAFCLLSINVNAIENVILFGDSLMAGYGLPQEKRLATVLQNNLNDSGYNLEIVDGSVSGSTSAGGVNRAEWSLSQPDIDLMILGLGANDMLRGISPIETEKNLKKIIEIAKLKNIEIILAGMIAPTTHGIIYKKKFDNIYPSLAKKYNLNLIPFLLEGVALKPDLNQDDGMHPNENGTLILSNTLKKNIIKIIKNRTN
ncbi:arylesterase [Candidatus Pelagibacter sp. Uisw_130]|uniref:arylesterase n=1 Tax=Candidatus Pelagibacter sp. Uisw_130 TaxID=3230989 RepID=UPI0039ED00E1